MQTQSESRKVIERFFSAIERRAYDELLNEIYAPNARIWHNADNIEQTPQMNVQSLTSVGAHVKKWSYELTRATEFPGGCVQQFTTNLTLNNGSKFSLYVCGVFDIKDGRVARLEEYYDALSLQQVMLAAGVIVKG